MGYIDEDLSDVEDELYGFDDDDFYPYEDFDDEDYECIDFDCDCCDEEELGDGEE